VPLAVAASVKRVYGLYDAGAAGDLLATRRPDVTAPITLLILPSEPPRYMHFARLRIRPKRPPLRIEQILNWADDWFAAHCLWPNVSAGLIPGTIDDTWSRIDDSLRNGYRGLPEKPRLSLAKLLEKHRGVRNSEYPPKLSVGRIEKWATQHKRRTGD